ncbi:MAG: hypothetical protein KAG37_11260, partial [Flavobacteriales bacterium]|nr:hypothetical protein [Flavobacteriales bacterium]
MKKNYLLLVALLFMMTVTPTSVKAGEPMCHVLICCKSCNDGVKFLVNGEWNGNHDYRDIDQARDVMQNIKDAGINTIIIDLTNPSQWEWLWDSYTLPTLENIQQVCVEKNMQYLIHIGGAINPTVREQENIPDDVSDFEYWDSKAKYISDNLASAAIYRKYGYGDDRPMLLIFTPGEEYWGMDAAEPAENKINLEKFYRGTMQVNNELYDYQRQETSGWGYRKTNYNTSKTIRYTSPQGGVAPQSWHKVTAEKFETDVKWVSEAAEYSVYGSYDDTCDGILWGIADTKNSNTLNPYWQ